MAEPLADNLRVLALAQHERGHRVPQIVNPDPGHAGGLDSGFKGGA
jgi:hypothetical protein